MAYIPTTQSHRRTIYTTVSILIFVFLGFTIVLSMLETFTPANTNQKSVAATPSPLSHYIHTIFMFREGRHGVMVHAT